MLPELCEDIMFERSQESVTGIAEVRHVVKTSPKSPPPRRSPRIRGSWQQKRAGRRDVAAAIKRHSMSSSER